MLPKQQIEQIKKQLIQQIDMTFPADKKEFAKNEVLNMNDEQLIEFLKRNNLIKPQEEIPSSPQPPSKKQPSKEQQTMYSKDCVFCSIIRNDIPAYKIDENKDNIAILELNPISKGHTIIIPKQHIETSGKLPQNSFSLAKKISKKLKSKFKPKEVQIQSSNLFGHEIINILPIYNEENLGSPRIQETKENLEKLKKKLEKKQTKKRTIKKIVKKQTKKATEQTQTQKIIIPRRIP